MTPKKARKTMHSAQNELTADEIWLPKQTADCLRVKEATLKTWRSKQTQPLPYLRVGKLIRYRKSDVLAFLDFCSQSGDGEER
jgi:Helix-turn-helix domain